MEGRRGSRKSQEAFNKSGAIAVAPPHPVGVWSRSGKHGNVDKVTRRAGYGGVFTLTEREHPRVLTAAEHRGEGSRK